MIPSEAAQLLAYMQAYDHRTVGEADVSVWATALSDVRYADAEVAMHAHYRDSSDWLDPNRMRRLVKALRNDRLERTPMPCPPYELANDPVGTIEWLNDWRQRIADGETPDAIEGTRSMPAIESAFPRMPIADAVTEAAKAREALRLARVAKAAEVETPTDEEGAA